MMQKRIRGAAAIGLAALAAAAVLGIPTQSKVTDATEMADFGVPDGAEVLGAQFDADGHYVTVIYKDGKGVQHTIGGIDRKQTPGPTERVIQYPATSGEPVDKD